MYSSFSLSSPGRSRLGWLVQSHLYIVLLFLLLSTSQHFFFSDFVGTATQSTSILVFRQLLGYLIPHFDCDKRWSALSEWLHSQQLEYNLGRVQVTKVRASYNVWTIHADSSAAGVAKLAHYFLWRNLVNEINHFQNYVLLHLFCRNWTIEFFILILNQYILENLVMKFNNHISNHHIHDPQLPYEGPRQSGIEETSSGSLCLEKNQFF